MHHFEGFGDRQFLPAAAYPEITEVTSNNTADSNTNINAQEPVGDGATYLAKIRNIATIFNRMRNELASVAI